MNYALVLAGGQGQRMGSTNVPKQFIEVKSKPILLFTLETIERNKNIDCACIVSPVEWHSQIQEWIDEHDYKKIRVLVPSGIDRQGSVHNGLCSLSDMDVNTSKDDNVMIMTAVCPFVAQDTIDLHFEKIQEFDGCITVIKAVDAITYSNDGLVVNRTLQKHKMFVQQGPQTFKLMQLLKAHDEYINSPYQSEINEDSELILNMGSTVTMIEGDRFCLKVTYPEDIAIVEALAPLFIEKEHLVRRR